MSKKRKHLFYWRAIVTVAGIRSFTPEDLDVVAEVIPGSIRYSSGLGGGELTLDWRFTNKSRDIDDAMATASERWRSVVHKVADAPDPYCTNYRVFRDLDWRRSAR